MIELNFENTPFIDFHTHRLRHAESDEFVEILSINFGENKVKNLYTIGFHPWSCGENFSEPNLDAVSQIFEDDEKCLGWGECGLDKLIDCDATNQLLIFEQQLDRANRLECSIVIHCVRAYDTLLKLKPNYPKIKNWVIHGYARHEILAKTLMNAGFYLSIAPHEKSSLGLLKTMREMPIDRLFLETDSASWLDIRHIYELVSKERKMDLDDLKRQVIENCKNFF